MADDEEMDFITVTFLHPTNNSNIEVQLDVTLTAKAIISELLSFGFMPDRGEYSLFVKSANIEISGDTTLRECGAVDGDIIQVRSSAYPCASGMNLSDLITVTFLHPVNDSGMEVELDVNMTAKAIISELIASAFVPDNSARGGYSLFSKRTCTNICGDVTLRECGVTNGDVIRVVPSTDAGGINPVEIWQIVYPYLDQIGTVLGVIGAFVGFGKWIKEKFSHYSPDEFVLYITERKEWDPDELANELSVSNKEAKALLKGFGYKKGKDSSLYSKTDTTEVILKSVEHLVNTRFR